jgi:hypothetical protein
MLTHFQDFYFSAYLQDFWRRKTFLLNDLDSNLIISFFMMPYFHFSKLTIANILSNFIEIKHIWITWCLLKNFIPILLSYIVIKIKVPCFSVWQYYLDGIDSNLAFVFILQFLVTWIFFKGIYLFYNLKFQSFDIGSY